MSASERIASANFVLKVSNRLDGKQYEKIISAIEDNTGDYPLVGRRSRGKFASDDVEHYIGNYETIGDMIRDNIVDARMAYDELGYDVEKAWCNKDVQKIVRDARETDGIKSGTKAFYAAFEEFAKYSLGIERPVKPWTRNNPRNRPGAPFLRP